MFVGDVDGVITKDDIGTLIKDLKDKDSYIRAHNISSLVDVLNALNKSFHSSESKPNQSNFVLFKQIINSFFESLNTDKSDTNRQVVSRAMINIDYDFVCNLFDDIPFKEHVILESIKIFKKDKNSIVKEYMARLLGSVDYSDMPKYRNKREDAKNKVILTLMRVLKKSVKRNGDAILNTIIAEALVNLFYSDISPALLRYVKLPELNTIFRPNSVRLDGVIVKPPANKNKSGGSKKPVNGGKLTY